MESTAQATTGSATVEGRLWGARADAFTTMEPRMLALYEAVLDDDAADIAPGTRLLDVGCGAGRFMVLAAQRGAAVSGIDAAEPLIDIARERLPEAVLRVGDMEALPWGDASFDVVVGLDAFSFANDPVRALREATRVSVGGAPVVIAAWGRRDHCESAGYFTALAGLASSPSPRSVDPFAFSEPGALEAFAATCNLTSVRRQEVLCVWAFPDESEALTALTSTGLAVGAIQKAGQERTEDAIRDAIAPYRMTDGGYRLENQFSYVIARVGARSGKGHSS